MESEVPLRYEVGDDGVALITLNRPERLNALTFEMMDRWEAALHAARQGDAVRAVIVTGAGRGFCSGADLKGDRAAPPSLVELRNATRFTLHRIPRALRLLDKPYLAAVNGPAVGAGMDLASMADVRFAAESARFGMTFVRLGLSPHDGGAYYLPRIIGTARALQVIWSGELFTAQQALEWGYVSAVYPDDQLVPAVRAYARQLAAGPPIAIQTAKRMVYRSLELTEEQALDLGAAMGLVCFATEDAEEGRRAFAEGRPPRFRGR